MKTRMDKWRDRGRERGTDRGKDRQQESVREGEQRKGWNKRGRYKLR